MDLFTGGFERYRLPIFLWTVFYVYGLTVGLLVQFFILPVLFPSAHWKDGLMVGGDWIQFHTEAVKLSNRISVEGWKAWSLTPEPSQQVMSGIAAFFYTLTGIQKPWVLLFYNAFLHATAGLVLFHLLLLLEIPKKLAIIFSIPFVVFPTSLTWVSQIHRDGLYILGIYLTFFAIALAFSKRLKYNMLGLVSGISGASLLYLAGREYALTIIYYFYLLFTLLLLFIIAFRLVQRKLEGIKLGFRSLAAFAVVTVFVNLLSTQTQTQIQIQIKTEWHWDPYIPDKIESQFYILAVWRNEIWSQHLSGRAGAIDEEVKFRSVMDFLEYTPRALQIGFFSPFPKFWFSQGSTAGGTIARYITPFEAWYLYLAWILLPFALWFYRKRLWFWLVFLICSGFIWFHGVAEPNVGPIVRKRYGYVMFLSAVSYATFLSGIRRWGKR